MHILCSYMHLFISVQLQPFRDLLASSRLLSLQLIQILWLRLDDDIRADLRLDNALSNTNDSEVGL